ncbi:MAG: hypothetical protein KGJ41_17190 [Rhodospirillales bacterium]|nr:hypothetical protein [Rhodospirillales bacterium]MDE2200748.1 hypothetical protein [Rhodospirillales bacterium]MDE2576794.1 hypothetical protein [Rhodospirillales bacterium]
MAAPEPAGAQPPGPDHPASDLAALLLGTALRHFVRADNAEAGREEVARLAAMPLDPARFAEAVAELLRRRLIREPIRLEEHALHCHWRLELTPEGVAAARALPGEHDAETH